MAEDLIFGSLRKKKKGQTQCYRCFKYYNNNAVTQYCSAKGCGAYLGGNFVQSNTSPDAKMITNHVASVRLNKAGLPIRIFVDLLENKVFRTF